MRTLFLNPPSFEGFDGGAGSRWPASREIESYWYPVWLCYPAGMLEDSRVVDAPPHKISIDECVAMARDYELLVLFTSTPGFHVDVRIAEMMKDSNSKLKVAFVGPPVTVEPAPGGPKGQLYDMVKDPAELNNLYQKRADIVDSLSTLLQKYKDQGHTRPLGGQ